MGPFHYVHLTNLPPLQYVCTSVIESHVFCLQSALPEILCLIVMSSLLKAAPLSPVEKTRQDSFLIQNPSPPHFQLHLLRKLFLSPTAALYKPVVSQLSLAGVRAALLFLDPSLYLSSTPNLLPLLPHVPQSGWVTSQLRGREN